MKVIAISIVTILCFNGFLSHTKFMYDLNYVKIITHTGNNYEGG